MAAMQQLRLDLPEWKVRETFEEFDADGRCAVHTILSLSLSLSLFVFLSRSLSVSFSIVIVV